MTLAVFEKIVLHERAGKRYYFGQMPADLAQNLTFVPVDEAANTEWVLERLENGYQRPGAKSRMRLFAQFLSENPKSVVPPVLLSGRGKWKFVDPDGDGFGRLEVHEAAAVIDGQHRLGGYIALAKGLKGGQPDVRMVDFILLEALTLDEEKQEFLTVNNTQKGVPKALTTYLKGAEDAQIAWALNEGDDSPFHGRISKTTMKRNQLFQLHSVAKEISPVFAGELKSLSVEDKYEYLCRYWTYISEALPQEWADMEKLDETPPRSRKDFDFKLLELTGYIAWMRIARDIFTKCYTSANGMNWERVEELVSLVGDIDWTKDGEFAGRTGTAGATILYGKMASHLP